MQRSSHLYNYPLNPNQAVEPLGLNPLAYMGALALTGLLGIAGTQQAIQNSSSLSDQGESYSSSTSSSTTTTQQCSLDDEECNPNDPCDKKLDDKLLKKRNIDAHEIKEGILGPGQWGQFNLCSCKDGRIILKRSQTCRVLGGEFIWKYWK